jgi:hypothetical protein
LSVDLGSLASNPAEFVGRSLTVRGFFQFGREGDAFGTAPTYDSVVGVAIQRSGLFLRDRSRYFNQLRGREVTFMAEIIATTPRKVTPCPPNFQCITVGYYPPFELKLLSPAVEVRQP